MNQIARQDLAFKAARLMDVGDARLRTPVPAIRIVHCNQGLAQAERSLPASKHGWLARLADGWRRYLSKRRTLRALDGLSEEQLKDIGFRRLPDGLGGYERLP